MTGRSCWCLELFRERAAHGAQHRRRRVQPPRARRRSRASRRETRGLRCHASVPLYAGDRPLGVMNLAMRGWRRLTRQELRSADDDRRPGRRGDRAGPPGRAVDRARARRRALAHRPRRPRHAGAGVHRRRACTSKRRCSHLEPRSRGAAVAAPRARRRPRRASTKRGDRSRSLRALAAREPPARRSARRARRAGSPPTPASACAWTSPTSGRCRGAVESELFRIAGEALTNVRKHAARARHRSGSTPPAAACV